MLHHKLIDNEYSFELRWDYSHMEESDVLEGKISREHWFSNKCADELAEEEASKVAVDQHDIDQMCKADELVHAVIMRQAVVNLHCLRLHAKSSKSSIKAEHRKWAIRRRLMIRSRHFFERVGKCLHCVKRGESAREQSINRWLRNGQCKGARQVPVLAERASGGDVGPRALALARRCHHTHRLEHKRGVLLCRSCGHFAARRVVGLKKPCRYHVQKRSAAMANWRRDLFPGTIGTWPEPAVQLARQRDLEVSSGSD